MDVLEKLAGTPDGQIKAGYVAADMARLEPLLKSGDAAQVQRAVDELQKWAGGPDGLRKAFAAEWLSSARKALGGVEASKAIATYGRRVMPGESVAAGAGAKARFAARPKPKMAMEHGAVARMEATHKVAPKVQQGLVPHPRLQPPPPDAAVADRAHAQGASLASKAAKHGFKLGLAAAAIGAGGGAAIAHHKASHTSHETPAVATETVSPATKESGSHTLSDAETKQRGDAAKSRWKKHGEAKKAA